MFLSYLIRHLCILTTIKVDFFWINRDQKSFEWFLQLLNQMEHEQEEEALGHHKFLDMHIYLTAALQRTDMRAVALQTAIDILHKKVSRSTYFKFVICYYA